MNFNTAIKEAIAKGASRVVRKPMAALRHEVASLKRQMHALRQALKDQQKTLVRVPVAPAAEEEGDAVRFRRPNGAGIRKLRQKLGLTQAELARLLDVSSLTVWKWEQSAGRIGLRKRTQAGFLRVRGLGKRDAKRLLAEMPVAPVKKTGGRKAATKKGRG